MNKGRPGPLRLEDLDFEFPQKLVASEPASPRDSARLMVIERAGGRWSHRVFRELPGLLSPGDCLVLNETKVLPCRLLGRKAAGGKAELLLVREAAPQLWTALSSGLKPGTDLDFPGGLRGSVLSVTAQGEHLCRFTGVDLAGYMESRGLAPLPPYILKKRKSVSVGSGRTDLATQDRQAYQTVYARKPGSIAAPTAGLHFTPELLAVLASRGIRLARATLHVGRGTFKPIETSAVSSHAMPPEYYRMEPEQARVVRRAMEEGRRVVAVGTTGTRTLETLALRPEGFGPGEGLSSLFIHPGHRFRVASALLTNFHLPRSTPLVLAAAFLGKEKLLAAYREAFRERYRLYSYGDAMLLL